MRKTLAFDVYGTLINTQSIVSELEKIISNEAPSFSDMWRQKQLEYSFRRGLMQRYKTFSECTREALNYTCLYYGLSLSSEQKDSLLQSYQTLPTFPDVISGLNLLSKNYRLFAFSNGEKKVINSLLTSAEIRDYFIDIVSSDEINSFKPNPEVYRYLLAKTKSKANDTWLISSNAFDVIGMISSGMKAAWIKRSETMVFDPWGIEPTTIAADLLEVSDQINKISK